MTRQPSEQARTRRRGLLAACVGAATALGVLAGWTLSGDETRPAGDELLHRASERLIAVCMARNGFEYAEQPPPSSAEPDYRHVLDDVGRAGAHGYGDLLVRPGAENRDANSGILRRLTPERQDAWHNTLMGSGNQLVADLPELGRISAPDNGCTAEAHRLLYGDLAGWYRVRRIVDHFGSYAAGKVSETPEYRTGLAAWAGCVRDRGYAAATPRELRKLAAAETPEAVGAREIAMARAEAECAVSTGFAHTTRALERGYRSQIERRFARELDALRSFERSATPRARKALVEDWHVNTVRRETTERTSS